MYYIHLTVETLYIFLAQAAKQSLLQFTKSHRTFEEEKREEIKHKEEAAKLKHEQKLSKSASAEHHDPIYEHIQKRKAAEKEAGTLYLSLIYIIILMENDLSHMIWFCLS